MARIYLLFAATALSMVLAACGGGDGGATIASTPSPVAAPPTVVSTVVSQATPLNPAPGITTGNYDAIAIVQGGNIAPAGSVRIAVDAAAKTYNLTVNTGTFRPPAFLFPWTDEYLGMKVSYVDKYSDGTTRPAYTQERSFVHLHAETETADKSRSSSNLTVGVAGTSSPGGRHASLGYWSYEQSSQNTAGGYEVTGSSAGYFAFGDRTAPGDIPASGTAKYKIENELGDGTNCDWYCFAIGGTAELSVDFGARSIAATTASERIYDFFEGSPGGATRVLAGTYLIRTNSAGSSPIGSSGTFDIAMAGTGTFITERIDKTPVVPASIPVSGRIAGAFFGPQAGEIAGIYNLPEADLIGEDNGIVTMVENHWAAAFTAVRTP